MADFRLPVHQISATVNGRTYRSDGRGMFVVTDASDIAEFQKLGAVRDGGVGSTVEWSDSTGTALLGPDGKALSVDPLRSARSLDLSRITYPGFYTRDLLPNKVVPFGSALINEKQTNGAVSSLAVDTDVTFNGHPTTRLTIDDDGSQNSLQVGISAATFTISTQAAARLLADGFVAAVKAESGNVPFSAILYVGDATYTNLYTFNDDSDSKHTYGDWTVFHRTTTGASSTTGTPDIAAATRSKLVVSMTSNPFVAGDVWLGFAGLREIPPPTVVLTFDDGNEEMVWLADRLKERGLPASFSISYDLLGTSEYLTETEALTIANDSSGLFELTNHAHDNVPFSTLGLAAYVDKVQRCRDYLVALGSDPYAARLHAYVAGSFDSTLIDALVADEFLAAREVGTSGRGTHNFACSLSDADTNLFSIPATCNLGSAQDLSTVQGHIATAHRRGAAFVMGHRFGAATAATTWLKGYDSAGGSGFGILNLLDWLAQQRQDNGWRILKWSDWRKEVRSGFSPMIRT